MPTASPPPSASKHDDIPVEPDRPWRPRPSRLLIGIALVAIGLTWSIVNAVNGPKTAPQVPIVHGPVETRVLTLDGLRVRPELFPGALRTRSTAVTITFHNAGVIPRPISPSDTRLLDPGGALAPTSGASDALRASTLPPGAYVTGILHFERALAPGAALVYAPGWSHGKSLRWVLWR